MREFLNRGISLLPEAFQQRLYDDLHSRWDTAYFELIVARTLQILGATLDVEPLGTGTTRVDYVATFPDGRVAVEATAPEFNAAMQTLSRNREVLCDIVRACQPTAWSVHVAALPRIGPNDSKAEFRRAVRELLAIPPPAEGEGRREVGCMISTGAIHMVIWPAGSETGDFGSGMAWWGGDSEERIRAAVNNKRKRRQGRNAGMTTLLAIGHPISAGFTDLNHFDRALFGEQIGDPFNDDMTFRRTGEFTKRNAGSPLYVGVLAFPNVGLDNADEPVLYHDSRITVPLPAALLQLEQRRFDPAHEEIVIEKAEHTNVIEQLKLIPREVWSFAPLEDSTWTG